MPSPAAAIALELRLRHRWGMAALLLYLALLAAIRLLWLEPEQGVAFHTRWSFALAVVVPLASTFMYLMAVFSFGLAGDLASRRSIFPTRMFILPVSNAALAGWPMFYGTLAMATLWLITRWLAPWPAGADVPWLWPALFAAVCLAWIQALTWMPYALRGLRVIVTVLWLATIACVVLLALQFQAPEPVMLALLAPHVPLAYLVARFAVAGARRGDTPDWRQIPAPLLNRLRDATHFLPRWRFRPQGSWTSPGRAQTWFEWRRYGWSLPALVAMLLPFELSLLFVFHDAPALVLATLGAVLLTPPFMAACVAVTLGRSSSVAGASYRLPPFLATRPMSSTALSAAKLAAAIRSTLTTWLWVLVAVPLALGLSGTSPVVADAARQLAESVGTPRAVAIGLLAVSALVLSTWKQLVQGLLVGLGGRSWLVKASVLVPWSFLAILVPLGPWILDHGRQVIAALWNALPSILALLVGLKIATAAWVAIRLYDGRLLSGRALVLGVLCWDAVVLALHGLLRWLLPDLLFPGYLPALVAILAVPLVRLAAIPLALAWNRHR